MATLVTRSGKGSPLTHAEVDANFTNLNTDKLELSGGTMTGNLSFGDNDKAIFGAGSDLQIYHDGNNSTIEDVGTGNLILKASAGTYIRTANGENGVVILEDGAVNLYYDNSKKLATTSTGIDVTGTVTADGLTVDGGATISSFKPTLTLEDTTGAAQDDAEILADASELRFRNATADKTRMILGLSTGDISFYEDTGTTAKFFWDASAESLGIGITPTFKLDVFGSALGTTAGDSIDVLRLGVTNTNNDRLDFTTERLSDGNTWTSAAHRIQRRVDNALMGYIQFGAANDDLITFGENTTERMRIDGSGNVGIGTSSPDTILSLGLSDTDRLGFDLSSGSSLATIGTYNYDLAFDASGGSGRNLIFKTGTSAFSGTERMRIDSSGNLLVGTTTVGGVGHTIRGGDSAIFNRDASGETVQVKRKATSGENIRFYNGSSNVGNISTTSSATAYNTSSDHRLKENVVDLTGATTRLKQLEPKRFNFIADANTTVDGFLAHEVQAVVPEAITGTHNEVDADGNPVYQGIDQSKLVPLLVATIKELEARITALETN